MKQVALGPENMNCPLDRKPMSEVCHKCPLWMKVTTEDPQTKAPIDEWGCSLAWSALFQMRLIRETQVVGIEINEARNQAAKAHSEDLHIAAIAVHRSQETFKALVENNDQKKLT